MQLQHIKTTDSRGAKRTKEQEFYYQVEKVREQARLITWSLPKTISCETRAAPDDLIPTRCLCFEGGRFIAELPTSRLSEEKTLEILGYMGPRWVGGENRAIFYTRVKGWKGLETIEIKYKKEDKEILF